MIQKLEQSVIGANYGCGGASFPEVIDKVNEVIDHINSRLDESENHGCGVEFPHFGANYPDAKCIDGYLWDMDSYEDGVYTIGGDDPCPICNTEKWLKDVLDDEIFKTRDEALEYVKMLKSKYKYKDSLPEEIPPYCKGAKGHPDPPGVSDLEGAAEEYASKTLCDPDDGPSVGLVKDAFIAGWNGGIKSQEKKIADAYEKGKQEGIREVRSWESSPGQGGY